MKIYIITNWSNNTHSKIIRVSLWNISYYLSEFILVRYHCSSVCVIRSRSVNTVKKLSNVIMEWCCKHVVSTMGFLQEIFVICRLRKIIISWVFLYKLIGQLIYPWVLIFRLVDHTKFLVRSSSCATHNEVNGGYDCGEG